MKIFVTAIALTFALPAAAQTAPANSPPAPATQHQDHSQMQHGQMQHGQNQAGEQEQHQGHEMADGCCADRNNNGRMDCCENMEQGRGDDCCGVHAGHAPAPAQPSGQQNH